jgi:hypothetical protein
MWSCVAPFLQNEDLFRQLLPLCHSAHTAAHDQLRLRWPWNHTDDPIVLWRRLLSQTRRRQCMRCGGTENLTIRIVCPCSVQWWEGCFRYHRRCCRLRNEHQMLALARCWLCHDWCMALCAVE